MEPGLKWSDSETNVLSTLHIYKYIIIICVSYLLGEKLYLFIFMS